jgi:hypothetical protein
MAHSRQWLYENGETVWLSMLVETFEKLSDPQERAVPCDPEDLTAAMAHLAHPRGFCESHLRFVSA